ncbi:unnamed protein product [Closterium sp. Yama58-4]|nr:unnamed protein product [Closterium sp. Yama58-4]
MARGARVLLVTLLSLILVAQHVAALRPVPASKDDDSEKDGSKDRSKDGSKSSDGSKDGSKSSDGSKDDGSSSGDDSNSKYKRLVVVLYEDISVNTNITAGGSGGTGSTLMYSTPLYKTKDLTGKVGQHYLTAVALWNDMVMLSCSLNFPNGLVTVSGAFKWTENVGRVAVTGATGAYIGYSGTAFLYGLDGTVKSSKKHRLVLKAFKATS